MRTGAPRAAPHGDGSATHPRPPAPFVVGLSRSGTTLVRMMLDAHPALAIPTGTFFIPEVSRACAASPDGAATFHAVVTQHWKWPDFHLDAEALRRRVSELAPFDVGAALRAFYAMYAARFGKPRWGDKSAYLSDMETVQQALPEAAFVHVVRDGRDVALSVRPLPFGPTSIADAAAWWAAGIVRAREQASRLHRYLEVRYEALVQHPERVLRQICDLVELPFDPAMLEYHRRAKTRLDEMVTLRDPAGHIHTVEERRAVHAGVERPPQPSRAGRWRNDMRAAERAEFEGRAGAQLVDLGYAVPARLPEVLCIVDRPGWAHDRKTDALAAALAGRFRVVKRFQAEVTAADIERADLVLLYYWLQVDRLGPLADVLRARRDRLLLGICSEFELQGAWRQPGVTMLAELPHAVFANNRTLVRNTEPLLGRPVAYTPNGVDTGFFRPHGRERPPARALRVGWAGSLKNQGAAHRGVHEYIDPAVSAVGGELCLAVREERWRGLDEMLEFHRSLDVYVCASDSEGTPNPCLEAAACGVPVVTTRVGCMPELIRHGENGFFVDRDAGDIARRLAELRDDPVLRRRLGAAARADVASWDWRHLAVHYETLFRSVLPCAEKPGD